MGRITMELLRKRSEHNEGEIHSLEELALHQEKLEKIELVDKVCRNLKILLLQNNAISKIENVSRLKNLEYLNLALNTVEKIENLEGCESLKKLDLTLNFIAELTSVKTLRDLPHLEQLYLVGNPCHDFPGYRDYVIGALPQLKSLDGREISKSERIKAFQVHEQLAELIIKQQERYFIDHEDKPPQHHGTEELSAKESAESTTTTSGKASDERDEEEDDEEFWNRKSPDTPEVRKELIRRIERQEEKKRPKDTRKPRVPRRLTNADGKPFNINEAKISFSLHDECERSQLVLDLAVPKHMCTTLIDADVQPFHVKVTMKGKIFQLVLPEEIKPDSSFAQRSQVTGHLLITMPKVYETSSIVWHGRDTSKVVDLTNRSRSSNSPNSRSQTTSHSQRGSHSPRAPYHSSSQASKGSSLSAMRMKTFLPSSPVVGRIEKSASLGCAHQPPSSLASKGRHSGSGSSGGRRHNVNFNITKAKSGGALEKDVSPLM